MNEKIIESAIRQIKSAKSNTVVLVEGPQGSGKSTAIRQLARLRPDLIFVSHVSETFDIGVGFTRQELAEYQEKARGTFLVEHGTLPGFESL